MFWGGLTAFTTVILYFVFANFTFLNVAQSNLIANVIGVILAYISNKKYVFATEHDTTSKKRREMISFFLSRVCTFLLETLLLVILVDRLGFDKNYSKIFTSFVTVILNYFVAKIAVFVEK